MATILIYIHTIRILSDKVDNYESISQVRYRTTNITSVCESNSENNRRQMGAPHPLVSLHAGYLHAGYLYAGYLHAGYLYAG